MKIISSLLLIALLISSNGCMTYNITQDAKGHAEKTIWVGCLNGGPLDHKPHPAYYGWLPLTVPGDIVILPIEGIWLLVLTCSDAPFHQ
jgi:hypothetical protein